MIRNFEPRLPSSEVEGICIPVGIDAVPLSATFLDRYETKDGRTPPCICTFIGGKKIPLTFDRRTISYVKRCLREEDAK